MGVLYQKYLTKKLSPLIYFSGIHKLFSYYSGRGHILMLHRVIPRCEGLRIHNHLSLEVSPDKLEWLILFFKRRAYEFIHMDELKKWLHDNEDNNKKFVIFTLDDGYRDNYDYAYPILKKHKIPFVIYVTTKFPDKKAILWWYLLEKIIVNKEYVRYELGQKVSILKTKTYKQKEYAFNKLRNIILNLNKQDLDKFLFKFCNSYGFDLFDFNEEMLLGWENIIEMSSDPLVSIGAHTLNHYNLTSLSDEVAYKEIIESKQLIEAKINKRVKHFSYPAGLYGKREVKIVKNCGFTTATTTKVANVFCQHIEKQYELPRISINSVVNYYVLKLHVSGFFQAILHNFTKVV